MDDETHPWQEKSFKRYTGSLVSKCQLVQKLEIRVIRLHLLMINIFLTSFSIVLLVIGLIWEIFILAVTIRFLIRFKLKKKIFTLFLVFINLSLIWRISYLSTNVYRNRAHHWDGGSLWEAAVLSSLNLTFFMVAGMLNIYNWARFTLCLKAFDEETKYK